MLPATATDAEWRMIMGTVLMTFALIVFAFRRRASRLRPSIRLIWLGQGHIPPVPPEALPVGFGR